VTCQTNTPVWKARRGIERARERGGGYLRGWLTQDRPREYGHDIVQGIVGFPLVLRYAWWRHGGADVWTRQTREVRIRRDLLIGVLRRTAVACMHLLKEQGGRHFTGSVVCCLRREEGTFSRGGWGVLY